MSYSIDQLKSALIQADAAGDTQSAQILANQIAAQQADTYVRTAAKTGGWADLYGWTDAIGSLPKDAMLGLVGTRDKADWQHPLNYLSPWQNAASAGAGSLDKAKQIQQAGDIAVDVAAWFSGEGLVETGLNLATKGAEASALATRILKNAGGSIAAQFAGDDGVTAQKTGMDIALGVAAEGVLDTPAALRAMKTLLAKNGDAIQAAADHVGVTPSMGVTTSRKWIRTLENLINKVPGGHLLNIQNAKSLEAMSSFVSGIKNKLGYGGDASALGREIESAIKKAEAEFKSESDTIYDALMKKLPHGQKTNTRRYTRLIEEMSGVNPRPGISEMSVPPIVRKYAGYLEDAGKVPQSSGYSNVVMSIQEARNTLKILDDHIGTGESADADAAAAKRMASALREDIEGAFGALGHGDEWRAVQDHYAAGTALLEQARAVMGRADTGDAIYTRLFGSESGAFSAKGGDTLRALKQVMTKDEWDHVAAEVVHRMGLEGAGTAAAEGRQFNPNIFLTNWTKLNKPAKDLLFSAEHNYDLEQLAKLSEGFKNLGRDANHSNTAHHMAMWGMLSAGAANPLLIPKLALGSGAATLMAKLLINPDATKLLLDASHALTPNQLQRVVVRMMAMAAAHPEMAQAFAELGGDN